MRGTSIHRWARRTISNHRRAKYNLNITVDELVLLAKDTRRCPLCGEAMNYFRQADRWNHASLDRKTKETNLGIHDVWIICRRCNVTKFDRSFTDFVKYCKFVSDQHWEVVHAAELAAENERMQEILRRTFSGQFSSLSIRPEGFSFSIPEKGCRQN